VRAHAALQRLAAAQRPEGGAIPDPDGVEAKLVAEDRDLVPVAPAAPEKVGAADVEGRGDEDAHASADDLVERRQQRCVVRAGERVDQNRVLAVAQRVRRHCRRDALPRRCEPPEAGRQLVDRGYFAIIPPRRPSVSPAMPTIRSCYVARAASFFLACRYP
jgi:hypothetical protein